ncbi:MAG: hypothetical protein IPM07_06180 [Anaerolineales bacterium]|nr:hypothetical protein [Anaerolineales bacterium]
MGVGIGGRPPKFEIRRSELDANFARRFSVLRYGKDVVAPMCRSPSRPPSKPTRLRSRRSRARNQEGAAWLAQFHDAYQIVRRKRANTDNTRQHRRCLYRTGAAAPGAPFASEPSKRTFSDYSRAQFIHDFHEFTGRQRLAHKGQVVKVHASTKSQTDSPAKSMWIVEGDSPYDGRYISDIEFVKE